MDKLNLLLLFGGVSSEHEVSCRSAASIMEQLDTTKIRIISVGITKTGRWLVTPATSAAVRAGEWECLSFNRRCSLSVDRENPGLLVLFPDRYEKLAVDCVFPVLHGKNGEDGTMQGLLEISGIPYVGSGVAASANAMDKSITKLLVRETGIRQANFRVVHKDAFLEDPERVTRAVMAEFPLFPLFAKPARAGSSVGISKATDEKSLAAALAVAAAEDEKIIVEEAISGQEVEVAVLGNKDPVASAVGEIVPSGTFYDYHAKYLDGTSELYIPARISQETADALRAAALSVYRAVGCRGLARVDFFVAPDAGIVFNEINTMPGFTSISMYPKLFEYIGISYPELLSFLIDLALSND